MSRKSKNQHESHTIYNKEFFIFLLLSVALFVLSFIFNDDTTVFIFLLIFAVISLVGIFIVPIKFEFTSKQIRLIWLLSFNKIIFWSNVDTIIENNFFKKFDDIANYQIIYRTTYKGKSINKEVQIPLTKKTKIIVEKYAKYKIL
jgi:hypothetical protein